MPGEIPPDGGLTDIQALINMWGQIFGTTGNSSTTTNVQSPEAMQLFQLIGPLLISQLSAQDYSPEAATKDSQPGVELILKQMMESGLPNIQGQEGSAGAYGSTTAQLLKNDLAARGAAEGAALIAKNKVTYGALRNQQANSLIALINSIASASRRTTTNSSTTTPNLASNPAARNAAAAAGLANALKPKPQNGVPVRKPKQPNQLPNLEDPDGLPADLIPNLQNPDSLPDNLGPEDMDDLNLGPTPEVTVNNTDNLPASPDLNDFGDDGLGDIRGLLDNLDLGSDLPGNEPDPTDPFPEPDPNPDPDPGPDFEFPDPDPDPETDPWQDWPDE